ncbi:MAG: dihydrofolate reductase [Bacteroidota bacterium]
MKLIIIAALNRKRVIGRNGNILRRIPEDLQRFKTLTMGHTVLMGRKTYESIGKILPGRRNVVITSRTIPHVECFHSIDEALTALQREEKVFIIGGGEIFRQTLHRADELALTLVDDSEEGDTFFPEYEEMVKKEFTLVEKEDKAGFSFVRYVKLDV